jgi:Tol biopolymer transport system component
MSADDPFDSVTGSISDGSPVDWDLAETSAGDEEEQARLRVLRDIEKVAQGFHALQASPVPGELEVSAEISVKSERRQWGDLVVLELARSGANGEVWRAWDPWLQREVALKFLQVERAQGGVEDSTLLEEARLLARVRHPGVVAVHGIAEHDGRVGMWMEFLEGPTLAAEIERAGTLPPSEVVRIGLALCQALEAIESAGVVHRDIKPTNVVMEHTGRIVLTDFGLGRRWELGNRPWRTSGTPIFMSPGVLAGNAATPRSDIYALGVTLRWALSGHPPFQARNLEQLKAEAEKGPSVALSTECPDAPPALVSAIDRAMAPNADDRFPGAAQMAAALQAIAARERKPKHLWTTALLAGAGAVLFLLAASFFFGRVGPPPHPSVTRFSVSAPPGLTFDGDPAGAVISPDGQQLAFMATDSNQVRRIWLRPLRSSSARVIEGTEGADNPFWSPDSRKLGFFANAKLMKVAVDGGSPEVLCPAPDPRGGTWGTSGAIVFAPRPSGGLTLISANGGSPRALAAPDTSRHEIALRWPQFLPDGRRFSYITLPARAGTFDAYVSSIDSPGRKLLARSDAAPLVAGDDQILLVRDGHLMTQRIDWQSLHLLGEPVSRGPSAPTDVSVGQPLASASMNGVLAYPSTVLDNTRLVWLDRAGHSQGVIPAPEGRYERAKFSPDGRRLLITRRTSSNSVALELIDCATGLATRLTVGSQTRIGGRLAWSPDGHRVAFSSNRNGPTDIFVKNVDTGEAEQPLYQSSTLFKEVDAWSPDGRYLAFEQVDPVTGWDIWLLNLQGEPKVTCYLRTKFGEIPLAFSPDGKWLAYLSSETGPPQICVQTFPVAGEKHVISDTPSDWCAWSHDGKEIAFLAGDGWMWSVPVTTTPTFHEGTPRRLFRIPEGQLSIAATPDLRRFVSLVPAGTAPPTTIGVELNWPAENEGKTANR